MVKPKAGLGYFYGLSTNRSISEPAGQSGAEKFMAYPYPSTIKPNARPRMAGDALNVDLVMSPGYVPLPSLPTIGGAEIRNLP